MSNSLKCVFLLSANQFEGFTMTERDDQLLQQIRDVETQCASVLTELRQFEQAVNNVRAQDLANIHSMVNSIAQLAGNLDGQVRQLSGSISTLSGQVHQLDGSISTLPRMQFQLEELDARLRRLGG